MTNPGLLDVDLLEPDLLSIGAAQSGARHPARDPQLTYSLGDVGTCPSGSVEKTQTLFLTDDSPSLTGLHGNDPLTQRYSEAWRAIEHIGRACTCGNELVSIIHFDYPSRRDVPPQQLHRRGLRRLRSGLRSAGLPGSSDLAPSLDKAERLARDFADGETTLVVMSDFFLTDLDPHGVLKQLISFDGQVHAVVLGATPPAQLRSAAPHVIVTSVSPTSAAGSTANAILDGLMTHRSPRHA